MAAAKTSVSKDQPQCCICLDVFTQPVTLPCGHDFCRTCITKYWDSGNKCQCPLCNKSFTTRPGLRVYTSEGSNEFKQSSQEGSEEQQSSAKVLCDICTEKAEKSCLVCLSSYCKTHLVFHENFPGLRRHTLKNPVEGLEHKMEEKYRNASYKLDSFLSNLQCVSSKTTDNQDL